MEFVQRRRDSCYYDEEDQEQSKHPPFALSSSSSSSIQWPPKIDTIVDPSGSTEPAASQPVEREHMFDKVVTPSDVGKLNRLVIPKQHAEKYFPLDSSSNEKGLLLNFEDRTGKPWRFRYSYWNSSQSYVMTKGWSRFVKEKRLDAGDTVSFGRGVGESCRDRLYIDWKRRPDAYDPPRLPRLPLPNNHHSMVSFTRSVVPWGRLLLPPEATVYDNHHQQSYGYNAANPNSGGGQYLYLRSAGAQPPVGVELGGGRDETAGVPMVLDSVPVVCSKPSAKRVRLFGVNLECPESDGDADASILSAWRVPQVHPNRSLPPPQLRLGPVEPASPSRVPQSYLDLGI